MESGCAQSNTDSYGKILRDFELLLLFFCAFMFLLADVVLGATFPAHSQVISGRPLEKTCFGVHSPGRSARGGTSGGSRARVFWAAPARSSVSYVWGLLNVRQLKSTHRDFRGPSIFCCRASHFLLRREHRFFNADSNDVDASIDRCAESAKIT